MPQEMPQWYARKIRAGMGCDGTDPKDPEGTHRCGSEAQFVILYDYLGDRSNNVPPSKNIPILACGQPHVDEKMVWLPEDHLAENIRVVTIGEWLHGVPGPELN